MRGAEQHLSSEEIRQLTDGPTQGGGGGLEDAMRHLDACVQCRLRMLLPEEQVAAGEQELAQRSREKTAACPPDGEWLELAAGILPQAERRSHLEHAAKCAHCGPLLKAAIEDVGLELTPEEESKVASLQSATTEWQDKLAEKITGSGSPTPAEEKPARKLGGLFFWPRWVLTTAATILAAIGGWWAWVQFRAPSVDMLLAQAYTERRTLEVRIPGARYSPMRLERAGSSSNLDKPGSLLKAEALISENLEKNPNDPAWLEARARADLLDGNYESAIKTLQRSLEIQPDSPSLLVDLGSAYFLRGESANRPIDYGFAIESLSKVLAKAPDDPIALFNRALICERMFLYTQAVRDWEHYLRVDSVGPWAEDARRRLAELKQKLQQHEQSRHEPLLDPAAIAKTAVHDMSVKEKIDSRIEEYLHVAITDWLPQAFPADPSTGPSRESAAALTVLATVAREQHDDSWLTDLLTVPTGTQFPAALAALSASVRADDRGDYSRARNSAHHAAEIFRLAANSAGELRAVGEEVYSNHLLWEGQRCIALLHSMDPRLKNSSYAWLRAQMNLEESNCANLVGDLGTYQSAIDKGIREAKNHHYVPLFLRGLGFEALSAASLGDVNKNFSLASEGLALFWSGGVDLMKGYNLYYDLDAAADGLHLSNLQVLLWQEATVLIDQHPDVLLRAMAHRWFGNTAYLANLPGLAGAEFSKASALFAASPKTQATARDHMDAEVWLANVEIRQGDVERAAIRLQAIKPALDNSPSFDPEMGFYSAQAEIAMRKTDPAVAESALRSAIYLSEWALNSFPSEGDRHRWAEQTRAAYRDLVEWKFRQGDATSALELWEWYRGAELRASNRAFPPQTGSLDMSVPPDPKNSPPLPTPTVVANELRVLHDQTVIAYATFQDGTAVWAYDDRGIFAKWIATPMQVIHEHVLRFYTLCSDHASDLQTLRTAGGWLYGLLIAPVEERLEQGRTLLFEPDDSLTGVPWEALVDRSGRYLAERTPIAVTPGLYRTMHLRLTVPITSGSPALVVSVPVVPEEGFAPLPEVEKEAGAVASGFLSANWFRGADATLSAIRREMRGKSVFHFAGHAIASPQRSGLMLAELDPSTTRSRLVNSEAVKAQDFTDIQLVVLSACHTAAEPQLGASGTESLVQALLSAGVPHVIASRWNIVSGETANFMQQFYGRLLAGSDTTSSIRAAQLAMASQPATAHPYYWAAFGVQGTQ